MRTYYKRGAANYRRIYDCIRRLNSNLQDTYFHILRGNNTIVDKLANQGVENNLGMVSIMGQPNFQKYVP